MIRPKALTSERPHGPWSCRGCDIWDTICAARDGDAAVLRELLERDPNLYRAEYWYTHPIHFAVREGQLEAVRILLDAGADPAWVGLGGDDLATLARDRGHEEVASSGCGGVLAAACKLRKRDLVVRLLEAGVRVPPTLTECRSYLWSDPDLLRLLLASGMDPDLPNWQHATPLHSLCDRDGRGRPRQHRIRCTEILLDAGATISSRDEAYRSTPLGWAARNGLADMVELLLKRGAPTSLADDEPWATPLGWAQRRGQAEIAATLQEAAARE